LLFQSQAAQKDRTELVVMITPQILPNNSPGVTPNLPRPIEPYLQPVPPKKSLDSPPVAFTDARGSAARQPVVTQAVPTAPATNAAASVDPATAANAVQALTPNTRPVINGDALPSTASQVPTAQPSRPLTPQEQKMFERARQQ